MRAEVEQWRVSVQDALVQRQRYAVERETQFLVDVRWIALCEAVRCSEE